MKSSLESNKDRIDPHTCGTGAAKLMDGITCKEHASIEFIQIHTNLVVFQKGGHGDERSGSCRTISNQVI